MNCFFDTPFDGNDMTYGGLIRPALMDALKDKILDRIVTQRKYRDKNYSAKQLAKDLGTNSRYISAVVNSKFQMNYTSLVNKYRIEEALTILSNPKYSSLSMKTVSDMVGFMNRQSFYSAFRRVADVSPLQYRRLHMFDNDKFNANNKTTE